MHNHDTQRTQQRFTLEEWAIAKHWEVRWGEWLDGWERERSEINRQTCLHLMDEPNERKKKTKWKEWTVPSGEKKHFYAISDKNKSEKTKNEKQKNPTTSIAFFILSWSLEFSEYMYSLVQLAASCADPIHRLKLQLRSAHRKLFLKPKKTRKKGISKVN